jgi:hypothetical protein
MAITFDATTNSSAVAHASGVVTFSATVNSGSDRLLVVAAQARDDSVAGVTFGGVALTNAVSRSSADGLYASVWYLIAPSVSTANVVITANTAAPTYLAGTAVSLFGVAQSSLVDDTDSMETTGANPAFSALTTATDGSAVVDSVASNHTGAPTMNAETNRTQRSSFLTPDQSRGVGCSTIITKSPAGSVTMGWDVGTNNSSYVGAAFKPAAGGGGGTPFFTRLSALRIR